MKTFLNINIVPPVYLINELDSIVPLQRLDGHSSGVDQLCQVYRVGRVDSSQIDEVLQSPQRQRLVLWPSTEEEHTDPLCLIIVESCVISTIRCSV